MQTDMWGIVKEVVLGLVLGAALAVLCVGALVSAAWLVWMLQGVV